VQGPPIDEDAVVQVEAPVADALQSGARVATGGGLLHEERDICPKSAVAADLFNRSKSQLSCSRFFSGCPDPRLATSEVTEQKARMTQLKYSHEPSAAGLRLRRSRRSATTARMRSPVWGRRSASGIDDDKPDFLHA
jgi:hypothetical protein